MGMVVPAGAAGAAPTASGFIAGLVAAFLVDGFGAVGGGFDQEKGFGVFFFWAWVVVMAGAAMAMAVKKLVVMLGQSSW